MSDRAGAAMLNAVARAERSGKLATFFFVFLAIGLIFGVDPDDREWPAEIAERERCEPLEWHAGTDQRAWDALIEQGWVERPDDGLLALYAPGCEVYQ